RCARASSPANWWLGAAPSSWTTNGGNDAGNDGGNERSCAAMLRSLIAFCLARRPLVLISFAAFLALGSAAFTTLNIEAYPDPAPPIIEIIAQNPGQSPEEMERYVTIPIEIAVASTPGLKYLRSNTADVLVLGGKTKEYQAEIDLNRMMAYGLTLPQIMNAISASNTNVGGRTIAMGEQSVTVRGLGVIGSLEDIGNIVLTQQGGVPVLLSDVAKVQIGFMPRLGIAGRDGQTDII